ncbi:MAG: hypothetical protein ACFFCZ_20210 [Promethearchaeota archaeon]
MDDKLSIRLFWVVFLSWLILYIFWFIYTDLNMLEAKRELALKGSKLITTVPALIFTIYFSDLLTEGNWMKQIANSPQACERVVIALIIAAAYCVA